jgi:2-desacetyl-2-hydroxyethyl bacteriochlorophyllide A dehydrogenase
MKGLVVTKELQLQLVDDIPVPEIGDYEALVKIETCMICNGTDLGIIHGQIHEVPSYPAVLGHECAGRIVQTGKKVTSFSVGDRIVRANYKTGKKYASAWGGFAEYGVVIDHAAAVHDGVNLPDASLGLTQQVVPPQMKPEDASLLITLKETYSAIARIGAPGAKNMVIIGDGPVGLALLVCAKLQNVQSVTVIGNHPEKLALCAKMGADFTCCTKDAASVAQTEKRLERTADVCMDSIGCNATIDQCLRYIREDGVIGVYGLKSEPVLSLPVPALRNFSVRFVQWPIPEMEAQVHEAVVAAILDGRIDTGAFITHRYPIEQFEQGFAAVLNRSAMKVVLTF